MPKAYFVPKNWLTWPFHHRLRYNALYLMLGIDSVSAPRAFPNCNANLNPTIDTTYFILENLFKSLKKYIPSTNKLLHLGGDEVSFNTWKYSPSFERWANQEGRVHFKKYDVAHSNPNGSFLDLPHRLLELFERRLDILIKSIFSKDAVIMRWEEIFKPHLFDCCFFPRKNIVVQMWRKPQNKKPHRTKHDILKSGVRGIVVNSEDYWYLDPNPKDQFWRTWRQRYLYEPLLNEPRHLFGAPKGKSTSSYILPEKLHARVFGGEVSCWGRCMQSKTNFNNYVWLPLAAISERLWSPRNVRDTVNAKLRLQRFLLILKRRFDYKFYGNEKVSMSNSIRYHSRLSDQRRL
jgi:N-acetyl-beta-hexosaminidase